MCFDCDHEYDSLADEIALEGRQEWDREARNLAEDDGGFDADEPWCDDYRVPGEDMDGDFDSGMASAGFGTAEDYGDYGQYDE